MSALLQFADSDCPFGIFKLFSLKNKEHSNIWETTKICPAIISSMQYNQWDRVKFDTDTTSAIRE